MFTFLMVVGDENIRSKLEKLFILYHKEMLYVAYSILNDFHEAEDVVQSAILKLTTRLDKIDEISSNKTRSFIVIVVRNLSINIYNQRKRRALLPIEAIDESLLHDEETSLDHYLIQLDLTKWTAQKLAMIDPSYADILTLRYYYDYSNAEIADLLNITEGNVRVKLHRAKKALADVIGGAKIERAD